MNLTDYFRELATNYDRTAGLHTEAQEMLSDAGALLSEHAPGGIVVKGSGGKGMATYTPWVGFHPDVTDTAQRGIYVVFLLSEDLEVLNLSLNQGMEYLRKEFGDVEARRLLARDADAIRNRLIRESPLPFDDAIELRSRGARQNAYEAGNIACRKYPVGALPSEAVMRSDLTAVLQLYGAAVGARDQLLLEMPGAIASPLAGPPQRPHPTRSRTSTQRVTPITARHSWVVN